jgi:hypothetical protein
MTNQLTANEQALMTLMQEAADKPRVKSPCAWATINGREIMCAPTFNKADNTFRAFRFVVDGKAMKAAGVWQAVRA